MPDVAIFYLSISAFIVVFIVCNKVRKNHAHKNKRLDYMEQLIDLGIQAAVNQIVPWLHDNERLDKKGFGLKPNWFDILSTEMNISSEAILINCVLFYGIKMPVPAYWAPRGKRVTEKKLGKTMTVEEFASYRRKNIELIKMYITSAIIEKSFVDKSLAEAEYAEHLQSRILEDDAQWDKNAEGQFAINVAMGLSAMSMTIGNSVETDLRRAM
jgi:hypothetical protein